MVQFVFEEDTKLQARLMVIGVGGGGGNAVNRMATGSLTGVELLAMNTDAIVLQHSLAPTKLLIGYQLTSGWGAGADPEIGRQSAEEEVSRIVEFLHGADMVFITAGMGGGTGTGAAPVIGRIAMEMGILAVGVVTKPFLFEGNKRMQIAEKGIAQLRENVDTLIVIPNQHLLRAVEKKTSLTESFLKVDEVLYQAVKGISDLITVPGLINLDFADVRSIMRRQGTALIGVGKATGDGRASECVRKAVLSPLLSERPIDGAKGILVNISGGPDLKISEVNEALSTLHVKADPDANIIMGAVVQDTMHDEMVVTLIATGFPEAVEQAEPVATVATGSARHSRTHQPVYEQLGNIQRSIVQESRVISMPPIRSGSSKRIENIDDLPIPSSRDLSANDLDVPTFLRKKPGNPNTPRK